MLRQEVYAEDEAGALVRLAAVQQATYRVRREQPRGTGPDRPTPTRVDARGASAGARRGPASEHRHRQNRVVTRSRDTANAVISANPHPG
jgi:hypothetical protein